MGAGSPKGVFTGIPGPHKISRLTRSSRAAALKLFFPPALERPEEAGLQLALGLMPVPHGAASWWGRAGLGSLQSAF